MLTKQHSSTMWENVLKEQFEKKRLWVKPGMRPFQLHINEKTILILDRIAALHGLRADAEGLNSLMNQITYQGTTVELTWARPYDKSYGKVRFLTHSKGLLLTIFT
jgi:hypothetical protein